jgi:ribonuclease HII
MKPKRKIIIGVDEAGRGPWAGPVVAASVKIKSDVEHQEYYTEIRDSKKLSEKKRQQLLNNIKNDNNIEFYYSVISNKIIDDINILEATKTAMVNCLNQYDSQHDEILIDGNQTVDFKDPVKAVIGGDDLVFEISAASIIAKQIRDNLMLEYDAKYPEYGFKNHKGYGTKFHREALFKYGPCPIHRFSFKPIKNLIS